MLSFLFFFNPDIIIINSSNFNASFAIMILRTGLPISPSPEGQPMGARGLYDWMCIVFFGMTKLILVALA